MSPHAARLYFKPVSYLLCQLLFCTCPRRGAVADAVVGIAYWSLHCVVFLRVFISSHSYDDALCNSIRISLGPHGYVRIPCACAAFPFITLVAACVSLCVLSG